MRDYSKFSITELTSALAYLESRYERLLIKIQGKEVRREKVNLEDSKRLNNITESIQAVTIELEKKIKL